MSKRGAPKVLLRVAQGCNAKRATLGLGCPAFSTLKALWPIRSRSAITSHVGDSRCYRLRADKLEQITKDHSLLQELIDRGFYTEEEARNSKNKNLVTRALGIGPQVNVDMQEDIVLKNDIYLLCSDGLTDLVEDEYIYLTIKRFSDNLEEAAKQLITKANENGGKDNISVMLCRIDNDFSVGKGWFTKLFARFD